MKKALSLILTAALMLSLCACGEEKINLGENCYHCGEAAQGDICDNCGALLTDKSVDVSGAVDINNGAVKMIAHKGLNVVEPLNSVAAFMAAGKNGYYGIEATVRATKDSKLVISGDDDLLFTTDKSINLSQSSFNDIKDLRLKGKDGMLRDDLYIPTFEEFIHTCKQYGCVAFAEIFVDDKAVLQKAVDIAAAFEYLDKTVFISNNADTLKTLKAINGDVTLQLVADYADDGVIATAKDNGFDIALDSAAASDDAIKAIKAAGVKINLRTIDPEDEGMAMVSAGVDYLTSNCLK